MKKVRMTKEKEVVQVGNKESKDKSKGGLLGVLKESREKFNQADKRMSTIETQIKQINSDIAEIKKEIKEIKKKV